MGPLKKDSDRFKYLFAINFSIFSASSICQIVMSSILLPWLLGLTLMGSFLNLYFLISSFRTGKNLEEEHEDSILESEKNRLMDDLEEEANRRKQKDRLQQN